DRVCGTGRRLSGVLSHGGRVAVRVRMRRRRTFGKAPEMARSQDITEEIGRRGQEIYEQKLRALVETEDNIGKIISIDVDTGDYEIDHDLLRAGDRLRARHPGATLYAARIGYDAVYGVGGTVAKTVR